MSEINPRFDLGTGILTSAVAMIAGVNVLPALALGAAFTMISFADAMKISMMQKAIFFEKMASNDKSDDTYFKSVYFRTEMKADEKIADPKAIFIENLGSEKQKIYKQGFQRQLKPVSEINRLIDKKVAYSRVANCIAGCVTGAAIGLISNVMMDIKNKKTATAFFENTVVCEWVAPEITPRAASLNYHDYVI